MKNTNKLKKLSPIAVAIAAMPITTAVAIRTDETKQVSTTINRWNWW